MKVMSVTHQMSLPKQKTPMTQAVSVGQLGPGKLNCVGHTKLKKLVGLNHFESRNK